MVSSISVAFVLLAFILVQTCRIIHRLFFHPLASVPGNKLAAATELYQFYWDAVCGGKFMFRLEDMHKKYGPIVRISPDEVHISEPAYWDVLYNSTNKLDKHGPFYSFDAGNYSGVTTVQHEVHRKRRGAMSKFLSAANVSRLEPQLHAKLKQMLDRFDQIGSSGEPCDCFNAFRSLTMDVISIFTEPRKRHYLDESDFAREMHKTLRTAASTISLQKYVPIMQLMEIIPPAVWRFLDPEIAKLMDKRLDLRAQARAVLEAGGSSTSDTPTVMDALATSDLLPPEDKTAHRIACEAEMVLGAGTETTSNSLAVMVFHVLRDANVHRLLRTELLACSDEPRDAVINFRTLDRLPYLSAVIQETLRIASPVSGRLPRVNPRNPMTYTTTGPSPKTYTFPPGTIMSMSQRDLHNNPEIFPEPGNFIPERWLPSSDPSCTVTPEHRRVMDKYFVPFSRGSRNCVGLELAKQEIALTAGNLFRRFDMELYETTERDVFVAHDWFAPFGPADSEGVRVKIKL